MDGYALTEAGHELRVRRRDELEEAVVGLATGASAALAVLVDGRLALALAIAAGFALARAGLTALTRHSLLERLARDRDAYAIEDVRRYGRHLTSRRMRRRLARSLETLVEEPEVTARLFVFERVREFTPELGELARALSDPGVAVEPTSAAECLRLVSDGAESPLLNPALPIEDLRATLLRIESGIHTATHRAAPVA